MLASIAAIQRPREPALPNDPMIAEQWYLHAPGDGAGAPGSINAVEAWRHVRATRPVVVAVFDGGLNYEHPDLEAHIWKNEREVVNGRDDDGNGYVDDTRGWNFTNGNNRPISLRTDYPFPDSFDHGTAVAGLIAAVPDNGIGIAGVGRNVQLMALRVTGGAEAPGGSHEPPKKTFPDGIRYATRNGARVVVCTTPLMTTEPGPALEAALREAEVAGVLLVRSAGNSKKDVDQIEEYRWLSRFSNVLVVGGTLRDGTLSPAMNFGTRVQIAAPCVDMVFPSFEGYGRHDRPGTSFAAPIVAAAAATLISQSPDLTPVQVIARLRGAVVVDPGMIGRIDGGRLDMAKLLAP